MRCAGWWTGCGIKIKDVGRAGTGSRVGGCATRADELLFSGRPKVRGTPRADGKRTGRAAKCVADEGSSGADEIQAER